MNDEFKGLDLVGLLDLLEPVPEPPAVSMIPQTPGWIVVGVLLALLIWWGLRRYLHHRRANAYRRAALMELPETQDDPVRIAALLRRTALVAFPRASVAGLHGAGWLQFLEDSFSGSGFVDGPGQVIADAPYRGGQADPELTVLARDWIRHHARGPV